MIALQRLHISSHQAPLDQLNKEQIDHHHPRQEDVVEKRQWGEAERTRQWRIRKQDGNRDNQERRDRKWPTGVTAQWIARRTNTKQDERLRGERFDEPAGMEEHGVRLENS